MPFLNDPSHIIRMNNVGPTPAADVIKRTTQKIQPAFVEIIQMPIRSSGVDERRRGIDNEPKRVSSGDRLLGLCGRNRIHGVSQFTLRTGGSESRLNQFSGRLSILFCLAFPTFLCQTPLRLPRYQWTIRRNNKTNRAP